MDVFLWKNYGQLGNRLLTFSNLIAISLDRGWNVHNLSFGTYANHFHYFNGKTVCSWPPNKRSSFLRIIDYPIASEFAKNLLGSRKILNLLQRSGHLFDAPDEKELNERDFEKSTIIGIHSWLVWTAWNLKFDELRFVHRSTLLEVFRPIESVVESIDRTFAAIPAVDKIVGVHIRRGDYAQWLGGRYYFSHDLYRQMICRITDLMSSLKLHFVIASNEPIPPEVTMGLSASCLVGSEIEDLYSLSRCDVVLGPPSTFADWAAFYGNGQRYIFEGELPHSLPASLVLL